MEGRIAEWALLQARAAGIRPLGVLVADERRLYVRMRPDWRQAIPPEDSDILRDYETYIPEIAEEVGNMQVLSWFESSSTLPIRIAARQRFQLTDANLALEALYRERVLLPPEPPPPAKRTQPPEPMGSGVDAECSPGRSTTSSAPRIQNGRLPYKIFWAITIPAVMAALLLLQRHILLQRYSRLSTPELPQKAEQPNPIAFSELPLTSFRNIDRPYFIAPRLRQPVAHTARQNAPARRQFEGELITDVAPSASGPSVLPAAPPLNITVKATPASPLPIPLPAAAPYYAKQNRFLHFFAVLFHKTPQRDRADDEHNPQEDGQEHEIETTDASAGHTVQGLR